MNTLIKDFPIFASKLGKKLIYFDNAATTQKPLQVIEALSLFYAKQNAPIHRGLYKLAENATALFEHARETIAVFIGASDPSEIIITKSATESINFITTAWGMESINAGDEIVLTELEHHANLIPWQILAKKKNAKIKFIPIDLQGNLILDDLSSIITERTKIVAFTHTSNAIGTHVDAAKIIKQAQKVGAKTLIDACQSAPHQALNVRELGCDFLVFSAHKMLGPTGVGILYIKQEVQHEVPPYQFGGGMIYEASYHDSTFLKAPQCYESGTQPAAQVIAFAQALEYLNKNISFDALRTHQAALCSQLIEGFEKLNGFRVLGPVDQLKKQGHLVSFVHDNYHAHDIAAHLDQFGICVRSGHFCAQPLANKLGIASAVRVSFYIYNSSDEVKSLLSALADIGY
ncbi:MAG TPA: SufS family cysteine desulfurase [Candidatus Babeliales bacterium]|nr:SufS family cysteine desulfurase [Candidatus Babeliales bacterium]